MYTSGSQLSLILILAISAPIIALAQSEPQNAKLVGYSLRLIEAFPNIAFSKPVDIAAVGDGAGQFLVLEQRGVIKLIGTNKRPVTVLDISNRLATGMEQGLLGIALDPEFKSNGLLFINYTRRKDGATVISRFRFSHDTGTIDPESELEILTLSQPYSNHNGGQLAFGPDGFLYIGLGDGGAAGDPQGHSQNLRTLLGSILRIDVSAATVKEPYRVPPDNLLAGNKEGFKEEIWAWGLRNPWRFSFDALTGKLWTGDVGQNKWEEVSIVERGKNYGWNRREGSHCFNSRKCEGEFVDPVCEYPHSEGQSITGGFVYRGKQIPELIGSYLFADFVSGKIWAMPSSGKCKDKKLLFEEVNGSKISVSSFGRDQQGEIYLLSYSDGRILKLVAG